METKRLIFMRHAETHNSKNKIYQTRDTSILPIDPVLRNTLKNSLTRITSQKNLVLVSELARSQQTADLFDMPTEVQPLINEFGEPTSLGGINISNSTSYIFKAIDMYNENPDYICEDGESLKKFIKRIIKFRRFMEKNENKLIICIGHGFYIRLFTLLTIVDVKSITSKMLYSMLKMRLNKLNYSTFIFEDGKWVLESWNVPLAH